MGQEVLAEKVVNFLIPDAEADLSIYRSNNQLPSLEGAVTDLAIDGMLKGFKKLFGGLWVGGTVSLTSSNLSFVPNAINMASHKGDYSLCIPLVDITDLTHQIGFVTGIIRITTKRGVMKMRCYGAKKFLARIAQECASAGKEIV